MTRRRRLRSAALAGLALAIVLLPGTGSRAFRVWGPNPSQPHIWPLVGGAHQFYHWDLRELPSCQVPWSVGNGTADMAGATEFTAVRAAFATWNAVTPALISFNEVAAPAGALAAGNLDGNNIVDFGGGLGANTLAVTSLWRNAANGRIIETDLRFNDTNYTWQSVAHGANMNGNPDVQSIGTHEGGHMLGLDHTTPGGTANPSGPIMEPFFYLNDDVAGPACGTVVAAGAVIITAGPNAWLDSNPNDCAGAGNDDFIVAGTISDGGNGRVDSTKDPDAANHNLHDDDQDGVNFLYNHDLGDAPDPCVVGGALGSYPTEVGLAGAGRTLNGVTLEGLLTGAEHIFGIRSRQPLRNYTYEWLGPKLDSECDPDQVDQDPFDDGLLFIPNPPIWGRPTRVLGFAWYANDAVGNGHDYAARSLWGNVWADLNQDCVWAEGAEHFIHSAMNPGSPGGANASFFDIFFGTVTFPAFPDPAKPVWVRARLDWGEDAGAVANVDGTLALPKGAAQFGEVEDYPFWCFNSYKQIIIPYLPSVPLIGVETVFAGDGAADAQGWHAEVDANDCILQVYDPITTIASTYSPSGDATHVTYVPETPYLPPSYRHLGWCQPSYPLAHLRTTLLIEDVPGPNDWVPSTNSMMNLTEEGTRVFVGTVDQQSGGYAGEPDSEGNFAEETTIQVGFRISTEMLPLEMLSPCDPVMGSLPFFPAGVATVTPGQPFEFLIPYDQFDPTTETLILEIQSGWTINPNTSAEIVEFANAQTGPVGVAPLAPSVPTGLRLAARPNPSTGPATISFALPQAGSVSIEVYDVTGRRVRALASGERFDAGSHEIDWDGRDVTGAPVGTGVYFFRLETEVGSKNAKMLILR